MADAIHLDTNFLIYYVGGGYPEIVRQVDNWLRQGLILHASAMAWAEFQCGPLWPEENAAAIDVLHSVLPVTYELAQEGGRLFHATGRRSRSLPDCLIAATAIHYRASLATINRDDFTLMVPHGLRLA